MRARFWDTLWMSSAMLPAMCQTAESYVDH